MVITYVPPSELPAQYKAALEKGLAFDYYVADSITEVEPALRESVSSQSIFSQAAYVEIFNPTVRALYANELHDRQEIVRSELLTLPKVAKNRFFRKGMSLDELPYFLTVQTGFEFAEIECANKQPQFVADFKRMTPISNHTFDSIKLIYQRVRGQYQLRLDAIDFEIEGHPELSPQSISSGFLSMSYAY